MKVELPRALDGLPQAILNNLVRWVVLYGGRSSAKSWSTIMIVVMVCMNRQLLVVCCRDTEKSIKNSVHRLIRNTIKFLGVSNRWVITDEKIYCPLTGSEIVFIGLVSDPEKIRSFEGADICLVEEAAKTPQYVWKVVIPTIRKPGSIFIIIFNPDWEDDYTYKNFVTLCDHLKDEGLFIRHMNYLDNPFCSEETLAEAERCKAIDENLYRHVWLGEPNTHSKQQIFNGAYVVEDFDPTTFETNKNSPIYKGLPAFHYGVYWGLSQRPTAAVTVFEYADCLYIWKSFGGVGLELDDIGDLIIDLSKSAEGTPGAKSMPVIKAMPDRPATLKNVKRISRYSVMSEAEKWTGDVKDGIAYLRGSFKKIIIHPSCSEVAQNFSSYWWKMDDLTGDITDEPIDMYNEYINAVFYALNRRIQGARK